MTNRARRLAYISVVSVLIAAAILLRYFDPFFVRALRLIAFDIYQQLDPEKYAPNSPIRIVDIDQQSLGKIGQWPSPTTPSLDPLFQLPLNTATPIPFTARLPSP